jgi:transcriptional regulator with PAS, ATPase and Fis domain
VVLSAEDLEAVQEGVDLVAVAAPLFETVLQTWEGERFMVSVSDRHGRLLYTSGHPSVLEQARLINAVPGGGMAEELIGTAVANVVLTEGRADYVLWNEHYCQTFHVWATIGAPIFHPLTHEVIGVVLSGGEELTHPRALDLIQRMAGRLEQLLHHEELVRRVTLLNAYHQFVVDHPNDVVVALDGRGHICGASPTIRELIDTPQQLLDTSILRLPGVHVKGFHPLASQQDVHPYEIQISADHQNERLHATVIPIKGGRQPAGTLVVFSRPRSVRRPPETTSSAWCANYTFNDLVGDAPVFQHCLLLARQAAQSDFPVLILGESGTGKELVAQAIHTASARRRGPFVAINCGAVNDELLAAELFGYAEGAFTGASKGGRKGKIEMAQGGALFLDEVEAMSPKMQVSLLRVLEERRLVRVGGEQPVPVDVRVMAASNEDLRLAVEQKRFRADLYHRLCVFPIHIPPLRARREDLPALARHFLRQLGFSHLQLSPETFQLLRQYAWPGNIRELKHVLLRAAHLTPGVVIAPTALPQEITSAAASALAPPTGSLREAERELIGQALAEAGGNLPQAAARLGIHRATLYRKLKRYGVAVSQKS